jgi:glyoxylase-like metal-dependent hydrolase (beta-lactamase superfamily II)
MEVQELRPGLWRWTADHPDWTPEEDWPQEVASFYYEGPDAVVLIDPLVPPDERERFFEHLDRDVHRADRPVAIVLSIFWHHRSAHELAERYGARVWIVERQYDRLVQRIPATRVESHAARATLPGGIESLDVGRRNDVVLWLPEVRALMAGDILLGTDDGGVTVCPESWLGDEDPNEIHATLRRLLELPVELILLGHGPPVVDDARAKLERALRLPR